MKLNQQVHWRRSDADARGVNGWRVAVIGGTGGIGRALSRLLASQGAHVIVVGQTFRDAQTPGIDFIQADLGLMREARRVATELPAETLDLVIFTTGIFAAPKRQVTPEGLERDLAVSYLSRFAVLREMAPRLRTTPSAKTGLRPRAFVMGYPGTGQLGSPDDLNADKSYKAMAAHMNTVAGNEALVLDAARRYAHARFFGLNPGLIKTNIRDNFFGKNSLKSKIAEALIGWLTPDADTYARRIAPLLITPEIEAHSGAMFNRKGRAILPSAGMTTAHIDKFMSASETLMELAAIHPTRQGPES